MTHERVADDIAPEFERVLTTNDVPPGALRGVTLSDGTRACVGNRNGTFFAVRDRCPHQKYPLSDGDLTVDGTIVCSWHGASYDCVTGRAVRGPVRGTVHNASGREEPLGRVPVYDVRVVGNDVFVRLPGMEL